MKSLPTNVVALERRDPVARGGEGRCTGSGVTCDVACDAGSGGGGRGVVGEARAGLGSALVFTVI